MALSVGDIFEGKVTGITKFGAFVELPEGKSGMVHISEVADVYVSEISDHIQMGQVVKVKVITINPDGKISLSIKKANAPQPVQRAPRPDKRPAARPAPPPVFTGNPNLDYTPVRSDNAAFEDMMQRYKQSSDEKMSDIKRGLSSKRGSSFKRNGK